MYLIKTPWWLRSLYPTLVWRMSGKEKCIYLTFDDGPHPEATMFAMEQLAKYNAKATFFCIGKNVATHPDIYQQLLQNGHSVANHTYNHVNGWKVKDDIYLDEIDQTRALVDSNLFRPPYGRIKRSQIKLLRSTKPRMQTIMWSVLSADFDTGLTGEQCLHNVIQNTRPGSIILFHDSQKAWPRMSYALPKVLEYFGERGFEFRGIGC